jgi:hypothetical protein
LIVGDIADAGGDLTVLVVSDLLLVLTVLTVFATSCAKLTLVNNIKIKARMCFI